MAAAERLSVIHVAAPAPVGGLESVLQTLAAGLHYRGHRVRVILVVSPAARQPALVEPLGQGGVAVDVWHLAPRAYLAERRRIGKLLQRERPDILHTHGYRPDILDGGVARRLGVPIVSTVHGADLLGGRTRLYEWLQGIAWRRFDAVIAVSRALEQRLRARGVRRDRVHLVPNAWSGQRPALERGAARQVLAVPRDLFLIGWVGRLIPAKGCDVFLRALAQLNDVPWHAAVVGDGPARSALGQLAAALDLNGRITFSGTIVNAAHLFPAFDLFVLSSRTEGSPMVLFEAMAARVPVVATAVGGVPETVGPDEAIVVPRADPAALAQAIREVHGDPQGAMRRAAQARRRLETRFALEPWLRRHEEIYRSVFRPPP